MGNIPWHFWEDATAFIQGLREAGLEDPGAVRMELRRRYCLEVPEKTVREILKEPGRSLNFRGKRNTFRIPACTGNKD